MVEEQQSASAETSNASTVDTRAGSNGSSVRSTANHSRQGISRRPTAQVDTEDKNFEGKTKDVGAVLGLKHERLAHKVPFEFFRERLADYVLKECTHARHVISLVEDMKNPMREFIDNCKPKIKRKKQSKSIDVKKKMKTEKELDDDEQDFDEAEEDDLDSDDDYLDPDDIVERMLLETKVKTFVAQEENLKNNMNKIYAIVWGQCSSSLQAVLKGDDDFERKHKKRDAVWLLEQIKVVTSGIDNKSNKYKNLLATLTQLFTMRQGDTEANDKFLNRFKSNVQTVELAGGQDFLVPMKWLDLYSSQQEKNEEKEKFMAMLFLSRSDTKRYGEVQNSLQKQMNLGIDQYPVTVALTFDLLVRESGAFQQQQQHYRTSGQYNRRRPFNRVMFLQVKEGCKVVKNDGLVASVSGSFHNNITCYNCNNKGHYSNECPYVDEKKERNSGVSFFMRAVMLTQNDPSVGEINPHWILLDTCSTASVAGNPHLVTNIRKCIKDEELHIATNGGGMTYEHVADLNLFPMQVHFKEASIATILSLKDVATIPGCYLTMDTRKARQIVVVFDGQTYVFKECADGLYFYDTSTRDNTSINEPLSSYSFLQTVEENESQFSKQDVAKAKDARELQRRLGFPGTSTLLTYLKNNMMTNSPVSSADVLRSEQIYGPLPQLLKGKFVDSNTPYVVPPTPAAVSPSILGHCQNLALFADYFFVNGLSFLLTNTEKLGFLTATFCERTGGAEAINNLNNVVNIHARRGFTITTVHGDNDFNTKKLQEGLPSIFFHACAAEQHVGHAERPIRTIKERSRCVTHDVPFSIFTRLMTKELILLVIEQLNSFPSSGTLSNLESPNFHVLGHPRLDLSLPYVSFGAYCLVFAGTSNTQASRAIPAIALRPSNLAGAFYFMSILSGKRLHAYQWKELPITQDVIDRVHELGTQEHQPSEINFEWSPGHPIDDAQGAPLSKWNLFDEHPPSVENDTANEPTNTNNDPTPDSNDNTNNELMNNNHNNEIENDHDDDDDENDDTNENDNLNVNDDANENENDDVNVNADDEDNDAAVFDEVASEDESETEFAVENYELTPHVMTDIEHSSFGNDAAQGAMDQGAAKSNKIQSSPALTTAQSADGAVTQDDANSAESAQQSGQPALRRSQRANKGVKNVLEVLHGAQKRYEVRQHKYFLQRKRKKLRPKVHLQFLMKQRKQAANEEKSLMDIALNAIFAQKKVVLDKNGDEVLDHKEMPALKGFKVFGEEAVAAMLKEFAQLHKGVVAGKPVVAPIKRRDITPEQMKRVMEIVNLIKKKRNGVMKGRCCLNGSKQKKFLNELESIASPTVSLEAILLTLGVDIFENRDVAVFDVPGAYLHVLMPEDKDVIMVLREKFVEIMCQVDPVYESYVAVNSKGQKVLYLKVLRALYGAIESALLWYELYSSTLEKWVLQ